MNDRDTRTTGSEREKNDSETDMNENDRSRKGKRARVKRGNPRTRKMTKKKFLGKVKLVHFSFFHSKQTKN